MFEGETDNAWVHIVDPCASDYNAKLGDSIASRFWNPGSKAMDTFTMDWSQENNYFCPPPNAFGGKECYTMHEHVSVMAL